MIRDTYPDMCHKCANFNRLVFDVFCSVPSVAAMPSCGRCDFFSYSSEVANRETALKVMKIRHKKSLLEDVDDYSSDDNCLDATIGLHCT